MKKILIVLPIVAVLIFSASFFYFNSFSSETIEQPKSSLYTYDSGTLVSIPVQLTSTDASASIEVAPQPGADGAVQSPSGTTIQYRNPVTVQADIDKFVFQFDLSSSNDTSFSQTDLSILAKYAQNSDLSSFSIQRLVNVTIIDNITSWTQTKTGTVQKSDVSNGTWTEPIYSKVQSWALSKHVEQQWVDGIDLNSSYQTVRITATRKPVTGFQSVDIVPKLGAFTFDKFAWWNTSFTYKKQQFVNSNESVGGTYLFVMNLTKTVNHNSDCSDIRIINGTETTSEPIYINNCNSTFPTYVFTSAPLSSGTANQTLFQYYGNPSAENVSLNPSPFPSNFKMLYLAEGNNATNITNVVNSPQSGTNNGVVYNWTGYHGTSMEFGNAAGYISPAIPQPDPTNGNYTFATWILFHAIGVNQGPLELNSALNDGGVRLTSGGILYGGCDNGGVQQNARYAWSPSVETWYNIAYTHDVTNNKYTLYINGNQVAQDVTNYCAGGVGNRFEIGRFQGVTKMKGAMDDYIFSTGTVLTADQIMALANTNVTEGGQQTNPNIITVLNNDTYQGTTKTTNTITYSSTLNISLSGNITDSAGDNIIDTVIVQINGTNITNKKSVNSNFLGFGLQIYNRNVGGNYYINLTSLSGGTYVGFFWANDSSNVQTQGSNFTLIVNKMAFPDQMFKFLNGNPANFSTSDLSQVEARGNVSTSCNDCVFNLYDNNTQLATGNPAAKTQFFGVGTHWIIYNTTGGQNYTGATNSSIYINVFPGISAINDTFNTPIFETNWTWYNASVYINDSANVQNITGYLFFNGTNQSFDYATNSSNVLNFGKNLTIPLINTLNNTSYGHLWNFTITYANGTNLINQTSNATQSVFYGFNFTSLASNKNSYSQTDLANFTAMSVNKFFNPAVNETVTLNMNGTTLTNTSWSFNWTWTGPAFNNAFQFANVPLPLESLNSTTITVNATYAVQFGIDKRSNSGLGSIRLTILRSAIGQCGTANYALPVMGLFEYNETTEGNQTQDISVNMTVDGNLQLTTAGNPTVLNSSFELVNNTRYYLCLDVGNTITANGELRYTQVSGGQPRSYFFQNAVIQNGTVAETKLFVSHNDAPTYLYSTSLKDSSNNILTGYIIQAQHDYLQNNTFETVNMMQTDNFGTGNMWLQPNNIYYKFVIMKNGTTFGVINPLFLTCTVSTSCQLNLIIDFGNSGVQAFRYVNQIASNCNYNNATLTLSCNWADPTGISKQMCLNIQEYGYVRPIQTAYSCVNTVSGGTSYTFSSYNGSTQYHYQLQALLAGNTKDNSTVVQDGFIQNHGPPVFGASGLVLGFIVIGTIAILGLFSPIIGILMIVFALGILSLMGFVDIGVGGVGTIAAVGLLVFWFIRRGG